MTNSKIPSAFAEATGGAIGALWTTLLFFPLDVAKIRLQAEADESGGGEEDNQQCLVPPTTTTTSTTTITTSTNQTSSTPHKGPKTFLGEVLVVLKQPDLWYAGLGFKLQLALVSTFVYFYVYTSLKRSYSRLFKRPVTFLPNLCLASLAGVANIFVTMPMDTVVTRLQVAPRGQRPSFSEMVRLIWQEEGGAAGGSSSSTLLDKLERLEELRQAGQQQSTTTTSSMSSRLERLSHLLLRLSRFWHGLLPALLLTSNPAINYAAYDAMKAVMPLGPGRKHHTAKETFLIGMLSKFMATLITYPLIRAKVMMMADTKRARHLQPHLRAAQQERGTEEQNLLLNEKKVVEGDAGLLKDTDAESQPPTPSLVLSPSLLMAQEKQGLLEILTELAKEGGFQELYVGLDGQIINTALKNAVLLNTKERLSRLTSFLLRQLFQAK